MNVYGLYRIGGFKQDEFGLKPYEKIDIGGSFGFPVRSEEKSMVLCENDQNLLLDNTTEHPTRT